MSHHQNTPDSQSSTRMKDCWKIIGVWGSNQCEKLEEEIHCRNCDVFTQAGRYLLEQDIPDTYFQEWAHILANKKQEKLKSSLSVLIFRVGDEWLALSSLLFAEVIDPGAMHTLPHCPNPVLLGLVNVHGEVQICISLRILLGIDKARNDNFHRVPKRMVLVNDVDGKMWVFPIDEILGVHRIRQMDIEPPPATVRQSAQGLSKGIFKWEQKRVALLDGNLLLDKLKKSLVHHVIND